MEKVRIQFVTRDDALRVSDAPIFAPVELKRYGLSELVNQLLEDTEKPVPFDFLIDGQVLRTSLLEYLTSKGLNNETTLTIEYTRSILPPSFSASYPHEDWVSSVHSLKSSDEHIATGSYDGVVRLWNKSGEVEKSLAGHTGAVKAVKWMKKTILVSASNDRTVHLWNIDSNKNGSIAAIFQGHTAAVDDVATFKDTIISASADTTLRVWSSDLSKLQPVAPTITTTKSTASAKRRKLAEAQKQGRTRASLLTLEGHTAPVTGVAFHHTDPSSFVYSVAQDHTIKTWDYEHGRQISSVTTQFPLLSVAALPGVNLVACGSSARHIMLHDPNSKTTMTHAQLIGHTNFVVSLAQSPHNQYQFVSGSHDGTCRIWDVRSTRAAFAIKRESGDGGKVFGVDWHKQVGILSAGEDKKLQINQATE